MLKTWIVFNSSVVKLIISFPQEFLETFPEENINFHLNLMARFNDPVATIRCKELWEKDSCKFILKTYFNVNS